ncbi:microsomal signal peptidase 25 kDa subunit (macronuclear) [Tetrahymena thermophila SB210]|uniref:Signal peptidase complex subunit 2 n=1 Tax=Tetrahymena thermophila (strain SB210) TaxID=312017 RepID=Q23NK4_TETTS|nr:microsomal signal peptidase 25 kDa subunit [Tetrahymena thermophila SB210]EAR98070.2 microsomal signal peptidase 25 kDa subunit [Tetrahymena thermophila SB210]|eukprot:XP_001018315.2 microsomal signal peptidase 25 kDa subunit [Tetrahymena thermophila SB210]
MSKQATEKVQEYRTENKYDPYLIRDTVNTYIENLLEKNEKKTYTFSNKFLDTKIVLGFLILIVILVSHYYPLPFPKNIYILIACVSIYFILSNYYSHYENSVEGDTFALFTVSDKKETEQKSKEEKVLYRFNSNIEMLSDELELSISEYNQKKTYLAQQKIKINEYFDQDGYLCTSKLSKLVDKMLSTIKSKSQ